jgi:hypothetical protein
MINVFNLLDIRRVIFSYIYPVIIKSGMVLQYRGSKKSNRYMKEFIGDLYMVDKYLCINLYPFLKANGAVMAKHVETQEDMLFFPNEDDLKIVLV